MTSLIGVVGDAHHPIPAAGAVRSVHYGLYRTFDKLRRENRAAADDQTALDAAVFYLLSSVHASTRSGLAIDAYSCLEYGGRMFWDADLWMRNAGLYGFRGAHDGHDACVAPTDWSEQHISLDVALGSLGQVNNSNFFNIAGMMVLQGAIESNVNASFMAEEVMRKRFPATGSVPCSDKTEWFICGPYAGITAYLGNRDESLAIQKSFAQQFHLPPFFITTEVAASRRKFGHYGTNWPRAVMLGMSGLRLGPLGSDPARWAGARTAALPQGWDTVSGGGHPDAALTPQA
eukprot:gene13923-16448_t